MNVFNTPYEFRSEILGGVVRRNSGYAVRASPGSSISSERATNLSTRKTFVGA
jgi:hypothetical protein